MGAIHRLPFVRTLRVVTYRIFARIATAKFAQRALEEIARSCVLVLKSKSAYELLAFLMFAMVAQREPRVEWSDGYIALK